MTYAVISARPAVGLNRLAHFPALAAAFVLACCASRIAAGWQRGRATYYGGPSSLSSTYDAARGEGSFGIIAYGACGYTNVDGSLPFPQDMYAAMADGNPDYPGSCGRCYEIKCVSGVVYDNPSTPIKIVNGYFNGDFWRPYLADINPSYKDTKGRSWPGNTDGDVLNTQCWDQGKVRKLRIADSCPCKQVLKDGDPGVKAGGETRTQEWCCGGEEHFDINYYAFEDLAHPVYGAMMLDYRPVDCDSGAELQSSPGYVSKTIFQNVPQPGWSWFPSKPNSGQISVPGIAPDGSGGTCVALQSGGGLSFRCRDCYKPGYQPFAGALAVEFWIKSDDGSSKIPSVKVFVLKEETQEYCSEEPVLSSSSQQSGAWFKIRILMSDFKCGIPLGQLTAIWFQDLGEGTSFCLANLKIV